MTAAAILEARRDALSAPQKPGLSRGPGSRPRASVPPVRVCTAVPIVFRPSGNAPGPAPSLSRRQTQVLEFVSAGLTTDQIAAALHLTRNTVTVHTKCLFKKLHVVNRSGAVGEGLRLGILPVRRLRPGTVVPHLKKHLRDMPPLLAEGLTDQEIADRLPLSVHGVKERVVALRSVLGASSRAQAVRLAVEVGYLALGSDGTWRAS